ncbi:hypothetical protein ACFVRD_15785 [Streptomyces sp. NPDC057908]|uniref:hypothetical protein n=1 Tax=Streptomyces sp. NPDC057908 TaxID=3346276 RepID=UPI0036EDE3DD
MPSDSRGAPAVPALPVPSGTCPGQGRRPQAADNPAAAIEFTGPLERLEATRTARAVLHEVQAPQRITTLLKRYRALKSRTRARPRRAGGSG